MMKAPSALKGKLPAGFTPTMVQQIFDIMTDHETGSLTRWNQILDILSAHKLPTMRLVKLCELMVRPKNRGGLGVNPHDCHEILAKVKRIGCDPEHLRKATAFETSPFESVQQEQRAFNERLVQNARGLLATLTGEERLLTVACSHFTQGCRAAAAGCRTNEETLKDKSSVHGTINLGLLLEHDKNGHMRRIFDEGLDVTVIPFSVEQVFGSEIADLAQSALNAEHQTFSQANELQIMSSMALAAENAGGSPDWKAVVAQAKASMPPCHEYLDVLADYVKILPGERELRS